MRDAKYWLDEYHGLTSRNGQKLVAEALGISVESLRESQIRKIKDIQNDAVDSFVAAVKRKVSHGV